MDSPYLGMIQYFAFDFTPKTYMACNGTLLAINQYAALFSLLGTQYGGNGTTNFALPDTRGRAIMGQGTNYTMGEKLGTETATLLTINMPVHSHSATASINANGANTGNVATPAGNFASTGPSGTRGTDKQYAPAPSTGNMNAPVVIVGNAGSSTPFNTLNPYVAVNCCICSSGLFPSRN